jgi:hypothetical protein
MVNLLAAHRHTSNNRAEIEASTVCGCIYCTATFSPLEIVAWSGLDASSFDQPDDQPGDLDAGTAMCPRCGGETVIGDRSGYPIDAAFLHQMNEAWCQKTIIRKPAARK